MIIFGRSILANNGESQMKFNRLILCSLLLVLVAGLAFAQDRSTGGLKGKVRVETGTPAGVAIVVRQGDREVARSLTDKKGEFVVSRLMPGATASPFANLV